MNMRNNYRVAIFFLLFLAFHSNAQDSTSNHTIVGKDFYAVSCDVEFLNIYKDTVVFYSNNQKDIVCQGNDNYDAYVYYFGPNGMLMYGAQSRGETTSYSKGTYQIIDEHHLVLTEGDQTLKFKYWLEPESLILVRQSKTH